MSLLTVKRAPKFNYPEARMRPPRSGLTFALTWATNQKRTTMRSTILTAKRERKNKTTF